MDDVHGIRIGEKRNWENGEKTGSCPGAWKRKQKAERRQLSQESESNVKRER